MLVYFFSLIFQFQQPKIQVASKYERRVDTRSYDDKKKLFEGVSILLLIFSILFIWLHSIVGIKQMIPKNKSNFMKQTQIKLVNFKRVTQRLSLK